MDQFIIKFNRYDRDPDVGNDHRYGAEIDAIIDEMVGGGDRLARGTPDASARIPDSEATIILHEDGPEVRFGPLPGYPDVDPPQPDDANADEGEAGPSAAEITARLWPLAAAWMRWPKDQIWASAPQDPRFLRIEFQGHRYEGRPVRREQVEQILQLFNTAGPTQPQRVAEP